MAVEAHTSFIKMCSELKQGYSFNLASLEQAQTIEDAIDIIDTKSTETIRCLSSDGRLQPIESYYFGKTGTWKTSNTGHIDPMNEATMNKRLINATYNRHKLAGKDGIVILAVITELRAEVLRGKDLKSYGQGKTAREDVTLAIEENLQKRHMKRDRRLEHGDKYSAGSHSEYSTAGVLYLAFKRRKQRQGCYNFDLCDLFQADTMCGVISIVTKRIVAILENIKRTSSKQLLLCMGYTPVDKHPDAEELDPQDQTTFSKEEIQKKWETHWTRGYSMDRLDVVAVVTKVVAEHLGFEDVEDCVKELQAKVQSKLRESNHQLLGVFKSMKKGSSEATCLYITAGYKE